MQPLNSLKYFILTWNHGFKYHYDITHYNNKLLTILLHCSVMN